MSTTPTTKFDPCHNTDSRHHTRHAYLTVSALVVINRVRFEHAKQSLATLLLVIDLRNTNRTRARSRPRITSRDNVMTHWQVGEGARDVLPNLALLAVIEIRQA
jgi:hypothetical protein